MKVTVGISNRHVHLTKETYDYLFGGKKIEKRNDLNQIGEFASTDTLTVRYKDKSIDNVRILGPFREHNQIELLKSDLLYLELEAPTRRSGDLEGTPKVILSVNDKSLETDGVIRAERHVHVPTSKEDELGLHERDIVEVYSPRGTFTAQVKVSENGFYEMHLDKDEKEEFGLENGSVVEIKKI